MMRKAIFIAVFILVRLLPAGAQDVTPIKVPATVVGGDTLPVIELNSFVVFPPYKTVSKKADARYLKLVYNVRKVYPYAKLAGEKLREYGQILDTIPTEKARKAFIKKAEKDLQDRFGDEIRDLTFSQGKILIKLVYRETGSSSYEIVRELRGKFSAFVWQTLAGLFGYDLKTGYDPISNPEDATIEAIVVMIEEGRL